MSPTTTILLNHPVCNNLIIISSPCCLLSTSEELHPKGSKSANGEILDDIATELYGENEKTFMDIRRLHHSPICPFKHGNSS